MDFFNEQDADIFCIQETKRQEGQISLDLPGYEQYWNYAEKKGYSGTAVFTKRHPLNVIRGIGAEECGRILRRKIFEEELVREQADRIVFYWLWQLAQARLILLSKSYIVFFRAA